MDIFCQMVMALHFIHMHKIIHRDIKSHNIFLMKSMQIKLGDFGIAKVLDSIESKARTVIGTPYYFSPELCKAEEYGLKSDIWSLGVLLYELCALDYPYKGKSFTHLI